MKSNKINSVLIIGCGWVGTELAKHLIAENIKVYGTTRSVEKKSSLSKIGINPIILELNQNEPITTDLPNVDSIIISISPGRGNQRIHYPKQIQIISKYIGLSNPQVIMYSSTSAYKGQHGTVTENDIHSDSNSKNVILSAEGYLRAILPKAVILRLGGLYGADRHPVNYLAGKTGISDGDAPVNLVHRNDVITATISVLENQVKSDVFNIVTPHHPSKKDLYVELAKKFNLEIPSFKNGGKDGKLVDGSKIDRKLGFQYEWNNLFSYSK